MLKHVAALLLALAAAGAFVNVAHATPVQVNGAVASKLEKHRVGIEFGSAGRPLPVDTRVTVRLRFTVTPDGTVTDIESAVRSVGTTQLFLKIAAIKALRQWTYNPYRVNGTPTAMRVVIEFHFHGRQWDATYP